jgi:hypothetical protein
VRRHPFAQEEVVPNEIAETSKGNYLWNTFDAIVKGLGLNVRVTGCNDLSHDINCSKEDFETILALLKEATEPKPIQPPK